MESMGIWIPGFKIKETIPDWYSRNFDPFLRYYPRQKLIEKRHTISVHLSCSDMNFSLFPFDTQRCQVSIQNQQSNKLAFEFEHTKIEVAPNNDFVINASVRKHNASTWIEFDLTLKRKSGLYLVTWYMPSAMFVIISWSR